MAGGLVIIPNIMVIMYINNIFLQSMTHAQTRNIALLHIASSPLAEAGTIISDFLDEGPKGWVAKFLGSRGKPKFAIQNFEVGVVLS